MQHWKPQSWVMVGASSIDDSAILDSSRDYYIPGER